MAFQWKEGERTTMVLYELVYAELMRRKYPNIVVADFVYYMMRDGTDILVRNGEILLEHLNDATVNWPAARMHAAKMTEALMENIKNGILVATHQPILVAPLSAAVDTKKLRVISDFSKSLVRDVSVNSFIQKAGRNVKYPSVTWIAEQIKKLPPRDLSAIIIDIKGAFTLIPVKPEFWYLLGHRWNGETYMSRNLPFGLASSPLLYSYFAAVILWLMNEVILEIVGARENFFATVYVDDHMIVVEDKYADQVFAALEGLLNKLNVPFSPKKVQRGKVVTFIGYQWDLENRLLKN